MPSFRLLAPALLALAFGMAPQAAPAQSFSDVQRSDIEKIVREYIISHPAVTCAIPGTRRVEYVDDNFGAALGRLPDAALRRRQEQFFDGLA